MKNNSDDVARQVLTNYLSQNNCRKTTERFVILDTVYSFKSFFSIQDLNDKLTNERFHVSRATLYNTLKLFMKLNLVIYHHLDEGVRYEASHTNNRCVKICTVCGKEIPVNIPDVVNAIENAHYNRFHNNSFSLFVYGVCSSCLAIQTRKRNRLNIKSNSKHHKSKNETRQS
ncbi:MAG: transcriptional repressor [Prevotella sp.]|nr:transcriptional repressor [Prevotella sp.]